MEMSFARHRSLSRRLSLSGAATLLLAVMAAAAIGTPGWFTPASAHVIDGECTAVGVGIDIRGEFQGTTDEAAVGQVGDTIEYTVTVSLNENQCPISDGAVTLTLPDGTAVVLDNDLNLLGGETANFIDVASYTIDAADIGTNGAPAGFVRASATVAAISHRASGLDQEVTASANFDTLVASPLEITKDATPTFVREFPWEIAKEVDPATWNLFDGDTGTSAYTVTVTKGDPIDSAFAVSGNITIVNTNPVPVDVESVTDDVDGIAATVDCGADFPITLDAEGGTLVCSYSADLPDATSLVNTATVVAEFNLGGTATADVDFTGVEPSEVINDTVTVSDTNPEFGGDTTTSTSMSFPYEVTFDCEGLTFEEGHASFTHENTATIVETEQTATASVTVDCYQLAVTKDVAGSRDIEYDWSVLKTGEPSTQTIAEGESADVMWTVTVDVVGTTEGELSVSGQIIISNPNPDRDAMVTEVTDEIGGLAAAVDCGTTAPYTVPAGGTLVCTYEATGEPTGALENIATAVQQNFDYDPTGAATEAGTSSYTGSATLDEGDIQVNATDFCANVVDIELGLNETVCADATELPVVFVGTNTYGPEGLVCGENVVSNLATLTEADTAETSDSNASVTIVVECAELAGCTPGFWKNHPDVWQDFDAEQSLTSAGFVFPASLADFGDDTLLEALNYGGGPGVEGATRILLRAAVASLLNADHDDVNFEMTEAEVIAAVNAALASEDRGTILELASELDRLNNTGCSIDAHGNPI